MKEGDYIVAVGDIDCKWMSVSDVMRLLKDVNEEVIEIQVVSIMDSNPQMVSHSRFPSRRLGQTVISSVLMIDSKFGFRVN